jgi:hypothetical protein
VGPILDAAAFAFAPQVVVAPLGCLDVIFNALTAPWTLRWQHEQLTRWHILGAGLVAAGAMASALSAVAGSDVLSVFELEQRLLRPTAVAFMVAELLTLLAALGFSRKYPHALASRGVVLATAAGMLMGNSFFLKGLIGIIQVSLATGDFDALWRPTPYLLALAAVGGALGGNLVMRQGLGEYKGVFMVTLIRGANIFAACLSACIVMGEMDGASFWQCVIYWSSIVLIVSGMLVIVLAAPDVKISSSQPSAQSAAVLVTCAKAAESKTKHCGRLPVKGGRRGRLSRALIALPLTLSVVQWLGLALSSAPLSQARIAGHRMGTVKLGDTAKQVRGPLQRETRKARSRSTINPSSVL